MQPLEGTLSVCVLDGEDLPKGPFAQGLQHSHLAKRDHFRVEATGGRGGGAARARSRAAAAHLNGGARAALVAVSAPLSTRLCRAVGAEHREAAHEAPATAAAACCPAAARRRAARCSSRERRRVERLDARVGVEALDGPEGFEHIVAVLWHILGAGRRQGAGGDAEVAGGHCEGGRRRGGRVACEEVEAEANGQREHTLALMVMCDRCCGSRRLAAAILLGLT